MRIRETTTLSCLAVLTLLLAGCAPAAPTGATGSDGASSTDESPSDSESDPCPTVPQEGYDLFSSDLVTSAPEPGFLYQAGTPIEWTLSLGAGFAPSMEISYVNEAGDAIPEGSYVLYDDDDNGTYSNDLGIFDSDANGRPGFATISLVNDGSFTPPADQASVNNVVLGVYCVSFAVE